MIIFIFINLWELYINDENIINFFKHLIKHLNI